MLIHYYNPDVDESSIVPYFGKNRWLNCPLHALPIPLRYFYPGLVPLFLSQNLAVSRPGLLLDKKGSLALVFRLSKRPIPSLLTRLNQQPDPFLCEVFDSISMVCTIEILLAEDAPFQPKLQ
jgi:hypothetical protein